MTIQSDNTKPEQGINVEEELQRVRKDMEDAEDELAATGFSVEQWMLIKRYISSAVHQQQLIELKAIQEMKIDS